MAIRGFKEKIKSLESTLERQSQTITNLRKQSKKCRVNKLSIDLNNIEDQHMQTKGNL